MSTIISNSPAETPTVVVDSRSGAERFAANAAAKLRSASTYAMPVVLNLVGVGVTLWTEMTPDAQVGLLGSFGLKGLWTTLAVGQLAHFAAVFKPAAPGVVAPQTLELLREIAALKLNERLRSVGQPEIPVPQPALTAQPAVMLVRSPVDQVFEPAPAASAAAVPEKAPSEALQAAPAPQPSPARSAAPQAAPVAPAQAVEASLSAVMQPADPWASLRHNYPRLTDPQIWALIVNARPASAIAPASPSASPTA